MLEGLEAFAALARIVRGEGGDLETPLFDPPFERLRIALQNGGASSLDLAVLMRHALRHESLTRGWDVYFETILVEASVLRKAGLLVTEEGGKYTVKAKPWEPEWLPDSKVVPADHGAMLAQRKRFYETSPTKGDPFLSQFKLSGYRSNGQRSAVRAALGMPPGAILIINLPTGEGKSLVFQAVQKIGFANDPISADKSLTIVIVPTVTLALDHERSCGGSIEAPLAYVGGQTARNGKIFDALREGNQALLFAAPEAVVGPLRRSITKLVESNALRAVVIDEAHLVEGWGTGFRTEFQTFAGICHQWRYGGKTLRAFRVIFLSATFSKIAKATLEALFSPEGSIEVVSAASIRPEPEFWIAEETEIAEREKRVVDALLHLPRPAILYVTKVDDAEFWYRHLRHEVGFQRVRMVHGKTGVGDREDVLEAWASGVLDLVVATSAFGLGIDYSHVRSIIHACLPEKLDRLYQEVGRAGRDGCTSISLLVPAYTDVEVAKSLSQQKIITVERGFQRWKAMFKSLHRLDLGDLTFGVRLDVAPSYAPEDIDLIGERSIDWNARVLSMMARSGMIRLTGIPNIELEPGEDVPPYQGIRIIEDGHMMIEVWEKVFEEKRKEIAAANANSFGLLKRFASGEGCPGELIRLLYPDCAHTCASCRMCRIDPSCRRKSQIVGDVPLPWPYAPPIAEALKGDLGQAKRLVVEYGRDLPKGLRARDVEKVLRRLDQSGFRVSICIGLLPTWMTEPLNKVLAERPWLSAKDNDWRRPLWPRGNSIIMCGNNVPFRTGVFNDAAAEFAELIFVPEGVRDTDNPERKIMSMLTIPKMEIRQFFERYLR